MKAAHDQAVEKQAGGNGDGGNGRGGGTAAVSVEAIQAMVAREPRSAYMLKRIANCADGHRTGKKVHIRMESKAPFTAREVIHEECNDPQLCHGEEIVGPFITHEDDDVLERRRQVAQVIVHYDDGTTADVTHADAIFWSMSALEKFCFPYYSAQYGPKAAFRMWSDYANDRDMVVVCHDPRCEACDPEITGVQNAEAMLTAQRVR